MANRNRQRDHLNFSEGQAAAGSVAGDSSRTRGRRKLGTGQAADRGVGVSRNDWGGGDFDFVGDMAALGIELGPNVNRNAVNHYIRTRAVDSGK